MPCVTHVMPCVTHVMPCVTHVMPCVTHVIPCVTHVMSCVTRLSICCAHALVAKSVLSRIRIILCETYDFLPYITPSPLCFWSCTTNIIKSCFMYHFYYIDHRNHILKCSLYPYESHHLLRFVISLTTKLLLNLKPD